MASISRPVGRNAAIAISSQWGRFAVQVLSLILFSRLLGPAALGVVAMATAVVGLAGVVGDFGLSLAATQASTLTRGQKSNLFWINTAVGALVAVAVFGASPLIGTLYARPEVASVARWLAVGFLVSGLAVQYRVELTRSERFGFLGLSETVSQLVGLGLGLAVAIEFNTYWAIVVQQLAGGAVLLGVLASGTGWTPTRPRRGEAMRPLLQFGRNTFAAQIVTFVGGNIDNVVVGRFWGQVDLGYYSRAYQLAYTPGQQLASPLTRVVLPRLASQANDLARLVRSTKRAQLAIVYSVGALLALLASSANIAVPLVLGADWRPAVPLVQILSVSSILTIMTYSSYWLLLARGETTVLFRTELLSKSVMAVLIVLAGGRGARWVAAAVAVGSLLLLLSYGTFGLPRAGVRPRDLALETIRPLLVLTLPTFTVWLVTNGFAPSGEIESAGVLAVALLSGVAIYALQCASIPVVRADARLLLREFRAVAFRRADSAPDARRDAGAMEGGSGT